MTKFSYSNYSALQKCGQYYQFNVIDKLPQPPSDTLEFGTAMHSGLHACLLGNDSEAAFMTAWEAAQWKDIKYGRFNWEAYKDMALKFLNTFQKKYGSKMKPILLEKRLGSTIFDIDYEGTPDAIVEWDGINVLLDYKTSSYNYPIEKTPSSLQMALYSKLAEDNGIPVSHWAYIVFNKSAGTIQTPKIYQIDKQQRNEMLQNMSEFILTNAEKRIKNYNNCVSGNTVCPYYSKCFMEIEHENE